MMKVFTYIAICLTTTAVVWIYGAPESIWLVAASALAVAIIGVPHGGLDHWLGRRILAPRFAGKWWLMFFPAYLAVALAVAGCWLAFPVATILLFFVASAWHFGREDGRAQPIRTSSMLQGLVAHGSAIAVGGLVIWIPSLVRPGEMQVLLSSITRSSDAIAAQQIVVCTYGLAFIFVPWSAITISIRFMENNAVLQNWVPLATALLAATAPILLSFSIYFCAWHSVQGLLKLQKHERLTNIKFLAAVLPLSITAVVGIAAAGWVYSRVVDSLATGIMPTLLPTLFIGLAAIAVPHLLLHELAEWMARSSSSKGIAS